MTCFVCFVYFVVWSALVGVDDDGRVTESWRDRIMGNHDRNRAFFMILSGLMILSVLGVGRRVPPGGIR